MFQKYIKELRKYNNNKSFNLKFKSILCIDVFSHFNKPKNNKLNII
jgi:hypothetical protein